FESHPCYYFVFNMPGYHSHVVDLIILFLSQGCFFCCSGSGGDDCITCSSLQYLMEGSYNKVFLAKGNIPAESYAFFIDILLDTVRDEIASCIEKAYEKILLNEATRMLFFTPKKMSDYAKKRGWLLGANNHYCFTGQQQKLEDATIPSTELAKQVIEYARQLEMIV
uniref:Proteasome 26S subunit, non-ATPase 8 n=1 Tax=Laticauda laticaudata TaxID=8630 RepID=A0A8C5SMX1_LATLA